MKKLMMFAAAMTIVGGAFAQCGEEPTAACALVYDVKISLKTTVGKEKAGSDVPCGEDIGAICYRVKGSVAWKGFLSSCDCSCDGFQAAELWLFNDKAQEIVAAGETLDWVVFNYFGKKNTDVEGFWQLEGETASLYAAGFGTSDKDGLLKSMNGNIVATLPAPECVLGDVCGAAVAYPCGMDNSVTNGLIDLTPDTVGYGTWSVKYNKSASQKSADNGYLPWPKWY